MTHSNSKELYNHGEIVITIDELLEWKIWPHFIGIARKYPCIVSNIV